MDSLQMDALAVVYLDQPVLHGTRRATFLHMSRGEAIIRYWGDSHAVAVPPEELTFPPLNRVGKSAASDEPIARDMGGDGIEPPTSCL
jgi:hypothetical protein